MKTKWQQHILDEIGWYEYFFVRERYVKKYKVLNKYLDRHGLRSVYMCMLRVLSNMVYSGQAIEADMPMFCIRGSSLYEALRRAGCCKGNKTIKRSLKELEYLGLVRIVPDSEIPSQQLNQLKSAQRNCKFRTTCYQIPIDNPEVLQHACDVIEQDKKNNVRAHARRSREGVMRASGEEAAHKIFVQQTGEGFSEDVSNFYEHYKKAVKNLFIKKGWTTEKEIINRMHFVDKESKKFPNKKDMLLNAKKKRETYSVLCLPNLIDEGLVQVVRFSKAIEEEYSIDNKKAKLHYGSSKIIVPGEEEFGD